MAQTQDEDWAQPFFVGHHSTQRASVTPEALDQANACNYDMLTTPITNAHFHSRVLTLLSEYRSKSANSEVPFPRIPALTCDDTPLTPEGITPQLLGFASPWIDICSPDPLIRNLSKQVLSLEIAYAAFCGLEYVYIQGPRLHHKDESGIASTHGTLPYARAIQEALSIGNHMHIFIVLPMIDQADVKEELSSEDLSGFTLEAYLDDVEDILPQSKDLFGTWDAWNLIRTTCKYNTRLFVALSIPTHCPANSELQSRWYSEPIKAIILPSSTFVHNKTGSPALPTSTRDFISRLMRVRLGTWLLLKDVDPIPSAEEIHIDDDGSFRWLSAPGVNNPTPAESRSAAQSQSQRSPFAHLEYIRYIQRQQPPRTAVEKYGTGYQDYLQMPLQPLTDNLESMTYEVFEKDPVKYDLYYQAIRKALREWKENNKKTSGPAGKVVVAVAGAGRGPLVTRALRASDDEKVEIEMWAVEKNPNAYVLLQLHNKHEWACRVTIVQSDMRSWQGPQHRGTKQPMSIDILISELLGSFADNELSPECLDGVLHLLSPQGISIPQSYTAFLTPLAAPKLHTDILSRTSWDSSAPETPAVVWLHSIDYLSLAKDHPDMAPKDNPDKANSAAARVHETTPAPSTTPNVLPVWSFRHSPLKEKAAYPISNAHNERYARLRFRNRNRGVCHGFGGYFESVLYPGVELSTHPITMDKKSKSMISWFPIFFPLKVPMYLPDHSELSVTLWRQTDDRKVWYEWIVESWGWMSVVEDNKKYEKRVRLGSSELHSSIKNGCMM